MFTFGKMQRTKEDDEQDSERNTSDGDADKQPLAIGIVVHIRMVVDAQVEGISRIRYYLNVPIQRRSKFEVFDV